MLTVPPCSVYAWCIQYIPTPPPASLSAEQTTKKSPPGGRLRMTCFSQHDLRVVWNLVSPVGTAQQLNASALGLHKTVMSRGTRIPTLYGFGYGVAVERVRFQSDREALTIDYAITSEDEETRDSHTTDHIQGLDALQTVREQRRLTRSIECTLPSSEGWDVRLSVKSSNKRPEPQWSVQAARRGSGLSSLTQLKAFDDIVFRATHSPLSDDRSVLKVRLVIEVSGPATGLRLNGLPHPIQDLEERDPSSSTPQQILQDVSSNANFSLHTTASSIKSQASTASNASGTTLLLNPPTERAPAAEKSILSRVRRNYIYFSSLLQEPEAKWKRSWLQSIFSTCEEHSPISNSH